MNHRPITEDDLHAYVDHALEPERPAEVATTSRITLMSPSASASSPISASFCARRLRRLPTNPWRQSSIYRASSSSGRGDPPWSVGRWRRCCC